ncbi:MAG TPA: response regulator [Aromatoleum sp.]|uniref:PAS domain-containing hybrid sensor histidine kinase/response regulator n=1 Tax=Aromatoleum sp. TaxID=2307007 RepID=UPI002B48237B|nr:response regulator [Aromatoleum sp.]HJV28209.1 response regulator [Aromatoleum sp.]
MKSSLLRQQLVDTFGSAGETALAECLESLQAVGLSEIAAKFASLLATVDDSYNEFEPIQRRANKARRLVDCLDLTEDILCEWNLAGGTIRASVAWNRRFGATSAEANRIKDWKSRIHPDDRKLVDERISTLLQGRAPLIEVEHRFRERDNRWTYWLLRARVTGHDADGKPVRLLVLHRDIADQKFAEAALVRAKEQAESVNRARGFFLANMSHEIRTPMNAILGMTELALDATVEPEPRSYLTTVKSSAESLLNIINDVLDLSKIEAGKVELESVPMSVRAILNDVVRAFAVSAHGKGLEIMLDVAPEMPDRVFGDPTRLRQILANLIGNAIKFTERGEVVVKAWVLRRAGMSLYLQIAVCDTGIGIAADQHEQIFDAFTQADVSTARRFGGTGLGLAISNQLVKLLDGQIWLESEPGKGTSFYFTARFAADQTSAAVPAAPLPLLQGRRVLVIDDCVHAADLLSHMLQRFGAHVEAACDAIQAEVMRSAGDPFDVLVVDAGMPPPAGFMLVNGPGRGEAIIVLLAHHGQQHALQQSRNPSVKARLVKPVFEAELLDAVRTALGVQSVVRDELDAFRLDDARLDDVCFQDDSEPLNVLLVEDTPVNQTLAVKLLTKAGHRVAVAANGREALERFDRQRFDLILMDVQMPVLDGMEATAAIRAREMNRSWVMGQHQRVSYIAAMTAHAMEGDRERCLAAGMDDYLSKPIRRQALDQVLKRAIEYRRAPKARLDDLVGQQWDA